MWDCLWTYHSVVTSSSTASAPPQDKNLRNVGAYTFEAKDNVPFGLEIDMDYVYTGQYALPGVVLKISKDTMKLVSRLVLPDGANDIRQLESDPTDPYDEYIYANTNTQPGQILKIRKKVADIMHAEASKCVLRALGRSSSSNTRPRMRQM